MPKIIEKQLTDHFHTFLQPSPPPASHEPLVVLQSTSQELRRAFDTISVYSSLLEESIMLNRVDSAYRDVYDEVIEIGINLKFIANSFSILHHYGQRQFAIEERPLIFDGVLRDILALLAPAIEKGNMDIRQDIADAPYSIYFDEVLLRHICWAALYLAVSHADDESRMEIQVIRDSGEATLLRIDVSQVSGGNARDSRGNFGPFMPLRHTGAVSALMARMESHVNVQLLRSFLEMTLSSVRFRALGDTGVRTEVQLSEIA